MEAVNIGVLAVQGSFSEHLDILRSLQKTFEHLSVTEVRSMNDLRMCDGLIIPGGESSVLTKWFLLNKNEFMSWYNGKDLQSRPTIWGTCAGLIMLARHAHNHDVIGHPGNELGFTIGGLDISVERNQYGTQKESFEKEIKLVSEDQELSGKFHGIFIRAPGICYVNNSSVKTLAYLEYVNQNPRVVAVENHYLLACTFHPELTDDNRFHVYFTRKVIRNKFIK